MFFLGLREDMYFRKSSKVVLGNIGKYRARYKKRKGRRCPKNIHGHHTW
jgi:hypothetical protein